MRALSKVCAVLAWIAAVFCGVLIQILCLYAFATYRDGQGLAPLILTAVAVVLLIGGMVVYAVCKKHRYIGAVLVSIAGVLFLICAFTVRQLTMPNGILTMKPDGEIAMDSWKLLWRHISPVLTPLFLWLSLLFSHIDKDRRETKEIMDELRQRPHTILGDETEKHTK